MKGYRPEMSFDAVVAAEVRRYRRGDEEAGVAFLAEHARGGPALELAIGTGRIALPLRSDPDVSPAASDAHRHPNFARGPATIAAPGSSARGPRS